MKRNNIKRFVAGIIASTMIFGANFSNINHFEFEKFNAGIEAYAVENQKYGYNNEEEYLYDCIRMGEFYALDKLENKSSTPYPNESNFKLVTDHKYTYEYLAEGIMDDPMLLIASQTWTNWSNAFKLNFKDFTQEEVYKTIIYSYLEYQTDSTEYKSSLVNECAKYSYDLYKNMLDGVLDDYEDIATGEVVFTVEEYAAALKASELAEKIKKYTDVYDKIAKTAKTVKQFNEACGKFEAVVNADEGRIAYLKAIRDVASDNPAVVSAIDSIIEECEYSYLEMNFFAGVETAANYGIQKGWKTFRKAIGKHNASLETVELTMDTMNLIFNTENVAANNLQLAMLYTLDQYAKTALYSLSSKYNSDLISNKDNVNESASAFNSAYICFLDFQNYANNWIWEYFNDANYEGLANYIKRLFSNSDDNTRKIIENCLSSDKENYTDFAKDKVEEYRDSYNKVVRSEKLPEISEPEIEIEDLTTDTTVKSTYSITKNLTLDHDMTINGNLNLYAGLVLNGYTLTVNGDLNVLAKTHLDKNNSVVTDSSGSIHMKYANDRINVHGDFCTCSTMSSSLSYNDYYQGTLAIDGNLYQYNGANGQTKNFYCYDGFTVEFVGSGTHTINSESSNTKLMKIKLVKGATISFNGSLNGFDDLSGLDFSVADSTIAKADNAYIKGKGIGDTNLYIQNDTQKSTIKVYVEEGVEETEKAGDINGDGKTTVADAILLLNWLLNSSELSTSDLQNADLCEDGVINVLDLCAMKRMLLSQE